MDNTVVNNYPLMDLVLALYTPYFRCKADRLLVIFHFFNDQKRL